MTNCQECQRTGTSSSKIYRNILKECQKNRTSSCSACRELSIIEGRIDEARSVLDRLLEKRKALAPVLNDCHDSFSNRLPVELVSRIFVHCRNDLPLATCMSKEEEEFVRAVVTPSSICQNWRAIAKSTRELWSVIYAAVAPWNCEAKTGMVKAWIKRSGEAPLFMRISLSQCSPKWRVPSQIAIKFLTLIMSHAQRWEILDIDLPSKYLDWMSTVLASKDLDRLQHFTFSLGDARDDNKQNTLKLKARPHTLILRCGRFSQLSMNWDRLTHLTIFRFRISDKELQRFRKAVHLTFCSISVIETRAVSSITPRVNESLQTLIVAFNPDFWAYVTFPSLRTLHLTNLNRIKYEVLPWMHFKNFLHRSACQLRELWIQEDVNAIPVGIVEVLKLAPELEDLRISGSLSDSFLSTMVTAASHSQLSQTTPKFLDQLKSLTLAPKNPTINWTYVIPLLAAMNGGTLETVSFRLSTRVHEDDYEELIDSFALDELLDALDGVDLVFMDNDGDFTDDLCYYFEDTDSE